MNHWLIKLLGLDGDLPESVADDMEEEVVEIKTKLHQVARSNPEVMEKLHRKSLEGLRS